MANNSDIISTVGSASTSQTVFVADVISEGPIEGLVNGEASVYLDGVALMEVQDATIQTAPGNQITFNGVSNVGTSTSDVGSINLGSGAFRFLHLRGVQTVTGVTVTHTEGTNIFTMVKGGTDFSTYQTVGVTSDLKRRARLVRENTAILGEVNSTGVFKALEPITSSGSLDFSDYTLWVDEAFIINSKSGTNITVGTNTPPAGTYDFYIGPLPLNPDYATTENPTDSQKINNTSVQFRTGSKIQSPLSEVGGVGSNPSIPGNFSGSEIKQCAPGSLPSGLNLYNTSGYPDGQSADGAPLILSHGPGGFNLSAAQALEVDELRIPISYGSLITTSTKSGNTYETSAIYDFSIRTTLDGVTTPWENVYTAPVVHSDEITAPISFEHTIMLQKYRPFDGFDIRITRLSRHAGTGVASNGQDKKSHYEGTYTANVGNPFSIIKDNFIYPHTAYTGITFSSETYSNIPERTYDCRGLKVRVPTTYTTREALGNPIASPDVMYSGFWNGAFKPEKEYTDNPAWIFYDIIVNNRYGAGDWISKDEVNKYALYRIARYCDELVDDGNNGVEPRFRANVYLTKAADVYKVLKDMASIFTGMLYFLEGQVTPIMDAPADPVYNFSKGNVIDGVFNYESTGAKTRANQCIVSWNNPSNDYASEALVVEDRNAIIQTGKIISENAVAFGATSEGQATRYGRWKLYTAQKQTEIITFKTALSAGFLQPGDIVSVQDADRYGTSFSGRLKSGSTVSNVVLDRTITLKVGYQYELSVLITEPAAFLAQETATINAVSYNKGDRIANVTTEEDATSLYDDAGNSVAVTWKPFTHTQTQIVTTGAGDQTSLNVLAPFTVAPEASSIWLLKEFTGLGEQTVHSAKTYRILGISEEEKNIYSIVAVEHYNVKYDAIETDYALAELPDEVFPPEDAQGSVPAPENLYVLTLSDFLKPKEEIKLQWDAPDYDYIAGYEIQHNVRDEEKIISVSADRTTHRMNKVKDGFYIFKVRTVSSRGNRSAWTAVSITIDDPFGENVPRTAGGMVKGALSNVSGFIDADDNYRFEIENYAIAPLQTSFDPFLNASAAVDSYSQDISGMSTVTYDDTNFITRFLTSGFIMFDRNNADRLKLIGWDFVTFNNLPYWYDMGDGSQSPTFSNLTGTIDIAKGSNKVVGTGTDFTNELDLGDIIQVDTNRGARVVSIVDDNLILIDRSFGQAITGFTPKTTSLQFDFETDAVIARVYYEGGVYKYDNFLTIDPDLDELVRNVVMDTNIQFINYDSDETQETSYSDITLRATATGYKNPEFQITGTGFSSVSGSPDVAWQTGTAGLYTKVIHNSSDIDYSGGAALPFTVTVREANDPNNANKNRTADISIIKVIGGSIGNDAKAVSLTAADYSIVYDDRGKNPQHSGGGSTITLTASSQGFLDPRYKFTGDGITDDTDYSSSLTTRTYSVPTDYFGTPHNIEVSVSEQGANTEEAYDSITITAVKPGTDGYTVILSNEAHTAPADPDGSNVNLTGSGSTIEVFRGGTNLTFVAGTPGEGEYSVNVSGNTGMSTPGISGTGGLIATISDFSSMTDDTEVVTYAINCENIQTVTKKQSFSKALKGTDGSIGKDGRTVKITTTNQVFSYDAQGDISNPLNSTLTATVRGASGPLYYEWFLNDVSQGPSTLNDNTYLYTAKASYVNMPDQISVEVREDSGTDPVVATDQHTAYGTKKGEDAVTVSLTNEAHTLPSNTDGSGTAYAGSGTYIRAWHGNTQCSYGTSGAYTFQVSAVGTDITPDSTPTTNSLARVYSAHSNMTQNTAFITYTITVRDETGTGTVVEKLQTFSKSLKGDPGDKGDKGDTGDQGIQGIQGNPGTPGADGDNVANGILYYNTPVSSDPGAPPAGTYTFSTGTISGASGWSSSPPTLTPGTSDTAYHVYWTARGANGANTASMSYSGRSVGIIMSGLVTFSAGDFSDAGGTITTIDGGNIQANTIKASQLEISNLVSDGGTGIFMDASTNSIKIYDGGTLRVKLGQL